MNRDGIRLEDQLGPHEPPYKSRGEAQIGRLLDRYGVPFLYEQPTLMYDRGRYRIWRPDFSLPTYGGLVVEYAGMPDVASYMTGVRHKRRAYAANSIPALFLYPRDIQGGKWPRQVMQRIDDAVRRYRPVTRYRASSAPRHQASHSTAYSRPRGYRR